MACSSGCPTPGAHTSYGQCLREKGAHVSNEVRATAMDRGRWNAELKAYAAARAEGIQPAGTSMREIDAAKRAADARG